MNNTIKEELYQLIDNCDNEVLLQEAKTILQSNNVKDWWDELTEEDKDNLTISEKEYDNGNFITHAQLMHRFEARRKK